MLLPTRMKYSFKIGSFLILMYFIAVIAINQTDVLVTKVFYYISILSFSLPVLLKIIKRLPYSFFIFCLGILGLGMINILSVGNTTYQKMIILLTSVWFTYLFYWDDINPKYLLWAIYLNAAVVIYHFAMYGVAQRVYENCSNNYISVFLLAPTVVYYTLLEKNQYRIPIFPAFFVWLLSFLGGGRGGFLATSILFFGLMLFKYSHLKRKMIWIFVLLLFILTFLSIFPSDFRLVTHFKYKGMDDNGRVVIWSEYINKCLNSQYNLLLGTELSTLTSALRYEQNLHNSFLFVHAYLGLTGFLLTLFLLLNCIFFSFKYKKWVYLLCLISFTFRGFTDHVFGANRLSPVFVFLLLYPLIIHNYSFISCKCFSEESIEPKNGSC